MPASCASFLLPYKSYPESFIWASQFNMGASGESGEAGVVQAVKILRSYWYLLLPLVLVVRFFYYKYASPLRNYPGPFLASGSRAWKGERTQYCSVGG